MSLTKNWLSDAGTAVINHLRDHYMAGAPHINTLGPVQFPDIDEEPEDEDQDEQTIKNYSEDPQWKYTPNKAAYQLRLKPFKYEPIKTDVSFYIRIDEGCSDDLENNLLSIDELNESFIKVEVLVEQYPDLAEPKIKLYENGVEIIDNFEVIVDKNENMQVIQIEYKRFSNTFVSYISSGLTAIKQEYKVRLLKSLKKIDDYFILNVSLTNLSPATKMSSILSKNESDKIEGYKSKLFIEDERIYNPSGNRYGYLMEYVLKETLNSEISPYDEKSSSKTVNVIIDGLPENTSHFQGTLVFRDFTIFQEEVPKMTPGDKIGDFFEENGLSKELSDVLTIDKGYDSLYLFQEVSIKKILQNIRENNRKITMLSARTGGGKTEAFILPILNYCIENDSFGTKALIFYPTKALANSQANRIISLLYFLNKRIDGRKITLGLLHGDIPTTERNVDQYMQRTLPLECPKCETGRIEISSGNNLKCNSCGEVIDFVKIRTRTQVYASPPDIVITNPDTIIWDIMMRPQNHSIFGRPVYVCNSCGQTYVPLKTKRVCDSCKQRNLTEISPSVPKFAVFDEVHIAKGTFGINTSLFLSRLEYLLKKYASDYHESEHNLIKIGSTATIANAQFFGKTFFNVPEKDVVLVPKNNQEKESFYERGYDENIRRHHIYLMPYLYASISTIGRVINFLESSTKGLTKYGVKLESLGEYLRILTFVNSIRSSNALISATKRTVAYDNPDLPDLIGGHTTDFDHEKRAEIETKFNKGDLNIIFATSTLEVGVDFDRIDVIIINGFPYSFNDYLQRIGRAGRRTDSLIISVCQNWKPVDHYYFVNGRRMLNNPQSHSEPVPITRDNISAVKKHSLGCTFDYLMSRPDADKFARSYKALREVLDYKDKIINYVEKAIELSETYREEIIDDLDEFLEYIYDDSSGIIYDEKLMKAFIDNINFEYQLTNLRSTDKEVPVEIRWSL